MITLIFHNKIKMKTEGFNAVDWVCWLFSWRGRDFYPYKKFFFPQNIGFIQPVIFCENDPPLDSTVWGEQLWRISVWVYKYLCIYLQFGGIFFLF